MYYISHKHHPDGVGYFGRCPTKPRLYDTLVEAVADVTSTVSRYKDVMSSIGIKDWRPDVQIKDANNHKVVFV